MLKPKLRVAAYCRVSTDSDEQLVSLQVQREHYETYIKANSDWEYAGIYYDEGITGTKKEKRAELVRLITDCENRKIDFIITKSISRFARNTMDCLELVRKLSDLDIFIYFEKENINTKSMDGELMLTILSSLAENESVSISNNNKWSIQKRFQNGTYKMSYPPYGYDNKNGCMVVNEEQAVIVRRIFSEVLEGKGTTKIAKDLNAEGIPSRKVKQWNASTINGILKNEKYVGDALYQKKYTDDNFKRHSNHGEKEQYLVKNNHEAIISHEIFQAIKKLLNQRREEKNIEKGSTKYQKRYSLSGKIICSECGSTFKRRIHYSGSSNEYAAWCCSRHIEDIYQCSMKFIREEDIHWAFVIMINKLIYGHKYILKPLLKSLRETDYSQNAVQIKELEAKLEENADRSNVLTTLMTKGYLEQSLFISQRNELKKVAAVLMEQKKALSHSINGEMTVITEVEQLLKWTSKATYIERFDDEIFERFVEKILVCSQEEIGFQMKCNITLKERLVK
ncbi:recombinase family protein [Anaerocolumna sp. MB42-C2]|nr:recombinase family protein [Anaerocolumna sp. MB42-C2]WMJ90751.1 recombinase family protein [Anaerocolumna sp. MB42-C2]